MAWVSVQNMKIVFVFAALIFVTIRTLHNYERSGILFIYLTIGLLIATLEGYVAPKQVL